MQASYYDPVKDEPVEQECSEDGIQDLLNVILALQPQRGYPALELMREDGASLSLATDGERALLVYRNSLDESFHSIGNLGDEGPDLIFDYFGSWSEVPQQYLVSLDDAVQCARTFYQTGTADTERVLFESD
jgi:Immunity protein Imm1